MTPFLLATALAMPPQGDPATHLFVEVVSGESHTCGRRGDGTVACWGSDVTAIAPGLPAGTYAKPVEVPGLVASTLAAGDHHTCAITQTRSVWCWGDNQAGQLGAGDSTFKDAPVEVTGIGPAMALGLGGSHSCVIGLDGSLSCWGDNLYGQLGTPGLRSSPRPLPVPGVPPAVAVAGGYGHTCAVTREGGVWCWGDNGEGQLGRVLDNGTTTGPPAAIETATNAVRGIDARGTRTCMVDPLGIQCWGPDPLTLSREGLVTLSVGGSHVCALTGGLTPLCFGGNEHDQLGAIDGRSPTLGPFGILDASSIAAGLTETCAARKDGPTICWGSYTEAEKAAAAKERREVDTSKVKAVERMLARQTELTVSLEETLSKSGAKVRLVISTVEPQTCANARIRTEIVPKGKRTILELGEAYLPDGNCIAASAPASTTYTFDADFKGRTDVILRWRKKEDFYQVYVGREKAEVIPLQDTFSEWEGPKSIRRIPHGTLALTCVDHWWEPACQRRSRVGLPTCGAVLEHPEIAGAPTVKARDWANDFLLADTEALFISPDSGHDRYRSLISRTFADGSGCTELRVRTWTGETWTNRPR